MTDEANLVQPNGQGDSPELGTAVADRPAELSLTEKTKLKAAIASKKVSLQKLEKTSVPPLLVKLGRQVYEQDLGREKLHEFFNSIEKIDSEIDSLNQNNKTRPTGDSISEKVKSAASSTADAARVKMNQAKRQKALYSLGKQSLQAISLDSLPKELIEQLQSLKSRAASIRVEIAELQKTDTETITHSDSFDTSKIRKAFLDLRWLQVLLIPFYGIGLIWILFSSKWSYKAKALWLGGFTCLLTIGMLAQPPNDSAVHGGSGPNAADSISLTEADLSGEIDNGEEIENTLPETDSKKSGPELSVDHRDGFQNSYILGHNMGNRVRENPQLEAMVKKEVDVMRDNWGSAMVKMTVTAGALHPETQRLRGLWMGISPGYIYGKAGRLPWGGDRNFIDHRMALSELDANQ